MKQVTLYIDDKFADMLFIGAAGGNNAMTGVIPLKKNNSYTVGADGILRPHEKDCEEVPR